MSRCLPLDRVWRLLFAPQALLLLHFFVEALEIDSVPQVVRLEDLVAEDAVVQEDARLIDDLKEGHAHMNQLARYEAVTLFVTL